MERRIFTSKMDQPFAYMFIGIMLFIIGLFTIGLLLEEETAAYVPAALSCTLITCGLLCWLAFDIRYEFREDHLFLRAGCFFTRIRYEDIEGYRVLTNKMDVLSGFHLGSSTTALEILSPTVMLGCVKVSPSDMDGFMKELEKRMHICKKVRHI